MADDSDNCVCGNDFRIAVFLRWEMNVYDFDKTIYDGDSTIDFYLFMLKKHPKITVYLPYQIAGFFMYKLHFVPKTRFKEMFFSFLKSSRNINDDVQIFWNKNQNKLKKWYVNQKKNDDVIISASPEFLLKEICERIGITNLIASEVDEKSGHFYSENCYGEAKVERFKEKYPDAVIDEFYSDSLSDKPLADLAEKAFLVKGDELIKW